MPSDGTADRCAATAVSLSRLSAS
eukprot:COSAG04_NODE_21817_length_367_cov_0.548507_2_plen_23_part_01